MLTCERLLKDRSASEDASLPGFSNNIRRFDEAHQGCVLDFWNTQVQGIELFSDTLARLKSAESGVSGNVWLSISGPYACLAYELPRALKYTPHSDCPR